MALGLDVGLEAVLAQPVGERVAGFLGARDLDAPPGEILLRERFQQPLRHEALGHHVGVNPVFAERGGRAWPDRWPAPARGSPPPPPRAGAAALAMPASPAAARPAQPR